MIGIVKLSISIIGGTGVSILTKSAVKSMTPVAINTFGKVCIGTASFLVAGMVSKKVTEHAEETIDSAVIIYKGVKGKIQQG